MITAAAPACCAFLTFCTKVHPPRSTSRIKGDDAPDIKLVFELEDAPVVEEEEHMRSSPA